MRFGYVLPNSWGVPDLHTIGDLAAEAEDLGADSLWVSHHVLHVGFVRERLGRLPYHDPLVTLAVVATRSRTAMLGVSVLVAPYMHAVTTAKTLATIDVLSEGRVQLGVGVGGLRVEHDAVGVVRWEDRGRYTDEFIDVLRVLWTPGPNSYRGTFHALDDVEAYPVPVNGSLPIVVGGRSPAALRRTALKGDGWHALGLEPDEVSAYVDTLGALSAGAGRSAGKLPVQLRLHIDVTDADPGKWSELASAYARAGVDELVLAPQSGDVAAHRHWLGTIAPALVEAR